jgi:hypothetical protein
MSRHGLLEFLSSDRSSSHAATYSGERILSHASKGRVHAAYNRPAYLPRPGAAAGLGRLSPRQGDGCECGGPRAALDKGGSGETL